MRWDCERVGSVEEAFRRPERVVLESARVVGRASSSVPFFAFVCLLFAGFRDSFGVFAMFVHLPCVMEGKSR